MQSNRLTNYLNQKTKRFYAMQDDMMLINNNKLFYYTKQSVVTNTKIIYYRDMIIRNKNKVNHSSTIGN
jgi:hypothetical protein